MKKCLLDYSMMALLSFYLFSTAPVSAQDTFEVVADLPSSETFEVVALQMLDENIGWVSGLKNNPLGEPRSAVWKTTDGGLTWTDISPLPIASPYPSTLSELFFYDEMTGWAGGENGVLYKTSDGGATWTDVSPYDNMDNDGLVGAVKSYDGSTVFATESTPEARVYQSQNSGADWDYTAIFPSGTDYLVGQDIFLKSAQEVWVCGNSVSGNDGGFVARSTDGGQTWENIVTDDAFSFANIQIFGDFGWASANSSDHMKITNDGGQTWSDLSLPNNAYAPFFIDENRGWSLQANSTSYKTEDRGQTWEPVDFESPATGAFGYYVANSYVPGKGIWVLGRTGFGEYRLYKFPISPTSSREVIASENFINVVNNPFSEQIALRLNGDASLKRGLEFQLFDVSGRLVFSEKRKHVNAGEAIVLTPTVLLAKGTYVLKTWMGEGGVAEMLIKQ
ncbi:MAG: hypothetical protein H6571_18080 [Lewinellaceae bacterium]|nr:hypothetical protein [Lewinellaceae bacterium]